MSTMHVRDLTKTYGQGDLAVDAVRHVDLDIDSGEVVLVMGPAGSGKTTLLLMLGAMLHPTSGSITSTRSTSLPRQNGRCRRFAPAASDSYSRTSTCSPR